MTCRRVYRGTYMTNERLRRPKGDRLQRRAFHDVTSGISSMRVMGSHKRPLVVEDSRRNAAGTRRLVGGRPMSPPSFLYLFVMTIPATEAVYSRRPPLCPEQPCND
jgi:hypothetical protein